MNNEEATALAIETAQLFEDNQSDETRIVEALLVQGYTEVEARKSYGFVKSAFSWAMLQKMGVVKFGSDFKIRSDNGHVFHVPVVSQQLFTSALSLGIGVLQHGYTEEVSLSVFEAVVVDSAEVIKAKQALSEGVEIAETEIMTNYFGFEPEDFGMRAKSWWKFWS